MAISVKQNQPLGFNIASDSCGCGGHFCLPVQADDSLYLQTELTAANNTNLVTNGEFSSDPGGWTLGTGFTISGGKLAGTTSGAAAVSPKIGLTAGRVYLVQAKVTKTSGSPTAGNGWNLTINSESLELPDNNSHYNQSLTASWIYRPDTIADDNIQVSANFSFGYEVDYVRVYEFSTPGLAIHDMAGNILAAVTAFTGDNDLKFVRNGAEVLVISPSELYEGDFSYDSVSLIANIYIDSWGGLTGSTGCMTATVFDAVYAYNRIRNGTFNADFELAYWGVGDNWTWDATGKAKYTPDGLSTGILDQDIILQGGAIYTLSFNLTGLGPSENMSLFIDTGSGAVQTVVTNTQLPYTKTIDLTGQTGLVTVNIGFSEGPGSDVFLIDSVSVTANDYVGSESACIDLQTAHTCTLFFQGTVNDNQFGFEAGGGVRLWLRLKAKLNPLGYPEEATAFRFSDGSRSLLYAQSDKEYEVVVTDAAEYAHDCLRLLRIMDTFTIDGTAYVRNGDYNLITRKSSDLLQAKFTVLAAQGLTANYSCS